jgi:hypothetical protein
VSRVCSTQHLEHPHRVVRRPPAPGPVRALQRRIEFVPKQLKVDHQRQPLQRVARRRQRRIPPIQIEQPRLSGHPHLSAALRTGVNHISPSSARVFRGVRLTMAARGFSVMAAQDEQLCELRVK